MRQGFLARFPARYLSLPSQAALSTECKPSHFRPLYFLKDMGPCNFDAETLSFAGTPVQQAMCLMRSMDETRNLGPPLQSLPAGANEPHRRDHRIADTRGARQVSLQARPRMGLCRLPVGPGFARTQQRSGCAAGALFRNPRHQQAELRSPRLPRRYRHRSGIRKSRRLRVLGWLGPRPCLRQSHRRHAGGARLFDRLARDQVRAGGRIRRRIAGPVPAQRTGAAAQERAAPQFGERRAIARSGIHAGAIRSHRAALHDRQRACRTMARFPPSTPRSTATFRTVTTIR